MIIQQVKKKGTNELYFTKEQEKDKTHDLKPIKTSTNHRTISTTSLFTKGKQNRAYKQLK